MELFKRLNWDRLLVKKKKKELKYKAKNFHICDYRFWRCRRSSYTPLTKVHFRSGVAISRWKALLLGSPKKLWRHTNTGVLKISSVYRQGSNYHLQVFLKECKYRKRDVGFQSQLSDSESRRRRVWHGELEFVKGCTLTNMQVVARSLCGTDRLGNGRGGDFA